jgi:hypothetical protein
MATIRYLHCRHCGEALSEHDRPYCAPCNLYLCYRAMPLVLGLLLTGGFTRERQPVYSNAAGPPRSYDDEDALIWE